MATGVLVVGVGRATRMLGYVSGHDKSYRATIRLGLATTTDDAEGEAVGGAPADGLSAEAVRGCVGALTGSILQRPSTVSAIKVDGRRAYARARVGEEVDLPERPVVVSAFDVLDQRPGADTGYLDLDVEVTCSSGTYVRALARDLGAALGVGGHLTMLRRLRVGPFDVAQARTVGELEEHLAVIGLAAAARMTFPTVTVTAADAVAIRHGRPIDLSVAWSTPAEGSREQVHALMDASGQCLALVGCSPDGPMRYLAVFAQP